MNPNDFTEEELEWLLFECQNSIEMGTFLGEKQEVEMAQSVKAKIEKRNDNLYNQLCSCEECFKITHVKIEKHNET